MDLSNIDPEAYNDMVMRYMQSEHPGFDLEMFEATVQEHLDVAEEVVEGLVQALRIGLSRPAALTLVRGAWQRLGTKAELVLGVLLLEYATTEYAREEADGISGRETE